MAGKLPTRTLKPGTGPKPINRGGSLKGSGPSLFGGGGQELPGGGGGKGTPGANYPVKGGLPRGAAGRAGGVKPVGYGIHGNPFYSMANYIQSKAYKRAGGHMPGPPPPQQPNQRLSGVNPTFPHTGAPAMGGSADEHLEAVRAAMVRAGGNGMGA